MSKMSFFDKIKVLVDVTSSSGLFIVAILLLISLAYLFITTNKKNAKSSKRTYLVIYLVIIAITMIFYSSSISKMFDYMMNNFFIAVYFPNLAIYFAAIIATNIILWVSIFNFKITKFIKIINSIIFCIIHYLLILIINVIATNKLDIFTQSSVYENKEALALIELSSTIFIVWILFLIIYKFIRNYQLKKEVKDTVVNEKVTTKRRLPENIKEVPIPYHVTTSTKNKTIEITPKEDTSQFAGLLTVEDYKLLLSILQDHKKREKEEQLRKQKEYEEQAKYRELQELYKSVK